MASTETEDFLWDTEPGVIIIDGEEVAVQRGDELIGRITATGLVVIALRKPALQ
jgi:hypothetical protein